jgi:hypothetical protein
MQSSQAVADRLLCDEASMRDAMHGWLAKASSLPAEGVSSCRLERASRTRRVSQARDGSFFLETLRQDRFLAFLELRWIALLARRA